MKFISGLVVLTLVSSFAHAKIINTIFGQINEQNPVVLSVLESAAMQRLKNIDQSGPETYFTDNFPTFSRYDHSLGVYALLKQFNVSEQEQIAGLLHDASHTVFSHLGDIVFQNGAARAESYQDTIHAWYLQKMGVDQILAKHNLIIKQVMPKRPEFTALEQDYPNMNADRIEYNLHTGMALKDLTQQDVQAILKSLRYDNNTWYFTNVMCAKRFAKLSTYYTKAFWGSPRNIAIYTVAGAMVKRAIEQGVITRDEFHFGTDQQIIDKIALSEDKNIHQLYMMLENIDIHYTRADTKSYDVHQPVKMRGINPYVLHNNAIVRLSELSIDFKNELENTEEYSKQGVYIKFKNVNPDLLNQLKSANN